MYLGTDGLSCIMYKEIRGKLFSHGFFARSRKFPVCQFFSFMDSAEEMGYDEEKIRIASGDKG